MQRFLKRGIVAEFVELLSAPLVREDRLTTTSRHFFQSHTQQVALKNKHHMNNKNTAAMETALMIRPAQPRGIHDQIQRAHM